MTDLASSAPHIHNVCSFDDLVDWGPQPHSLSEASHSTGRLLHKGPDNIPESGIWVCTPGRWRLSVPRDEFCHFVSGRATYRADTGEVIKVAAGTCVMFRAGWTG
ncbi:MAG: cupin domain-containing protein [Pseudomonadota bacterium]